MRGGTTAGDGMMRGFTLVELLVALAIGMVILAGMIGMFIFGSKQVSNANDRMGRAADLHLAASIMEGELRQAQAACWDGANLRLIYRPLDSTSALPSACDSVAASHGAFQLRAAGAAGCSSSATACICWDRPNKGGGCQEMLRGVAAGGFDASEDGNGVWHVTISTEYHARDGQVKTLREDFRVWPRNQ